MGRSSAIDVKDSIRWYLWKSVQHEDTWVWSTRHGGSSEDIGSRFSSLEKWWRGEKIRNFDYETLTASTEDLNQELWSKIVREQSALKEERVSVTSREKRPFSQGDRCKFRHETQDRAQKPEHTATLLPHFWVNRITKSKCVEKRSIRSKSNHGKILLIEKHYKPTCSTITSITHLTPIRKRWSANWAMWRYSSNAKLYRK